ncbi:MAG: Hsp20 family protein [Rhodospirillales bacterium]
MRTIDMSPLFRHTVGFDRMQRLLDAAMRHDTGAQAYPPYNIEAHGENAYRISMAVAGFSPEELSVTVKEQSLIVTGNAASQDSDENYLHRGIARRNFERRFELAEGVEVSGSSLVNGLLNIDLERVVPEEKQPRTIEIATTDKLATKVIEDQKAA